MRFRTRLICVLACGFLLTAVLVASRLRPRPEQPQRSSQVSVVLANSDCRACHEQVWQEWEASFHSRAWSDDQVQAAFAHFGHDRQCQSCHAPQPVFHTGLTNAIELRESNLEAGVDCIGCHALPDGTVAASRDIPEAPCRPVKTPSLTSSAHCGGCHRAIHEDWLETPLAKQGKTCQACHMPAVADRDGGFSHVCRGAHDDDFIRTGATMQCRQQDGQLIVTVSNTTEGHNFPGERHNRVLTLQVFQYQEDGEIAQARQEIIKDITPFRGESSADEIRPGRAYEAGFDVMNSAVRAEVRLLYKRFPWIHDRDALTVRQQEVRFGDVQDH